MDHVIYKRIEPVIRRTRFLRVAWTLALIWSLSLMIALVLIYLNRTSELDVSQVGFPFLTATLVASVIGVCFGLFKSESPLKTVKRIEREFPELDSSLLTAIEQQAEDGKSLGFLQQAVMRRAVTHSYENSWASLVPRWQLITAPLVGFFSFPRFTFSLKSTSKGMKRTDTLAVPRIRTLTFPWDQADAPACRACAAVNFT